MATPSTSSTTDTVKKNDATGVGSAAREMASESRNSALVEIIKEDTADGPVENVTDAYSGRTRTATTIVNAARVYDSSRR